MKDVFVLFNTLICLITVVSKNRNNNEHKTYLITTTLFAVTMGIGFLASGCNDHDA